MHEVYRCLHATRDVIRRWQHERHYGIIVLPVATPRGNELHLPAPNRADLEREGVVFVERRDPSF
ncbi:MAG: hypothetical protein J7463_09910 [Roseiflexus sp.]|jgi:hypothetical protein|nr:hypothetical protein [Roseiflexus sp.]MBO9335809.1 hypothetical protein [Roseiflexus sp.]MBO9365901.1 hypothetical protein [Roseiflexus sp.]MBO9381900.1 hypothetical protein [Roseiflexus sp.]MBO9389609.1 hypothetical protein [Roseiflexus sp.]